jgi:hypothetical protein
MWFAYATLALGIYTIANGILHDVFVLINHKTGYDRTLLRLLMDGHILITGGMMYVLAFFLLRQNSTVALLLCMLAALSLSVYCVMIFPFLKSFVTLLLNVGMFGFCLYQLITHTVGARQ